MTYTAYRPPNIIGVGAIGGAPRRTDILASVGDIMAFPFHTDIIDATGNHVINVNPPEILSVDPAGAPNNYHTYDDEGMFTYPISGDGSKITATSQAHQLPLSSSVSFGFLIMARTWATGGISTPTFMFSGVGSAGDAGQNGFANYALHRQYNVGWRYVGAGGSVSSLGGHLNLTPAGRWLHIALTIQGPRSVSSSAVFYINGYPVWSGSVGPGQAPLTNHEFGLNCQPRTITTEARGFMCNNFVSSNFLDAATIKQLADESFGHASPYTPHI